MDKCEKCGAVLFDGVLSCGSVYHESDDWTHESRQCFRRQLAAANAKLLEAARLAQDTQEQVATLTADLVGVNERAKREAEASVVDIINEGASDDAE